MIRALLIALGLLFALAAQAQPERKVGDRVFLVHTVDQGQTLFAIARHYAVPVNELRAANPAAELGLSIGQEVLVPKDAIVKKEARKAPELLRDGELLHVVARKETLFGIAQRYRVEMNDLLERNPELNNGLQPGMSVIIPALGPGKGMDDAVARPATETGAIFHTVAPGETLYALGKRYEVEPEAIKAANGGLPEGLKAGGVVRIPVPEPEEEVVAIDTLVSPVRDRIYRMAFLLPFSVAKNDSLARRADETGLYPVTRLAVQFWAGASMALDSLQKLGLNAEVQVVDVGDNDAQWDAALERSTVAGMDLYMGPFHRQAIEHLARKTGTGTIVCPVPQSNKVILGNPRVSKAIPSSTDRIIAMAHHASARHSRDNLVLVCPEIFSEKEEQDLMAKVLRNDLELRPDRGFDSLRIVRPKRKDLSAVIAALDPKRQNVLVVPSEDVEFVFALVGKLAGMAEKTPMIVYGMPNWMDNGSISRSDLERIHYRTALSNWIDHNDPRVKDFTRRFRERYKNEAGEYAFLGFDITFFYGSALLEKGTAFPRHFDELRTAPLQMGFRMERTGPENGTRNSHVVIVEQSGLELHRVP